MNMPDPELPRGNSVFQCSGCRGLQGSWSSRTPNGHHGHGSSARDRPRATRGGNMKTTKAKKSAADADTMRPEYDFSNAVRGVTAARYAQGTNVVLLDPDVAQLFPDSQAVNEALRTRTRLGRVTPRPRVRHKRTA